MRYILLFLVQLTGIMASAQYTATDQGSTVTFTIKNLGFKVGGSFTGVRGKVSFDPNNLSAAGFEVSVDAASVNTDNSMRDEHLKGEDYFDAKNHPRIQFVSTGVKAA